MLSGRQTMDNVKQLFVHGTPVCLLGSGGGEQQQQPPSQTLSPLLGASAPTPATPVDYARMVARQQQQQARDDAFFVCDVGRFLRKHEEWTRTMPRVQPYYAVKCNNNPLLLHILAQLGCNFDCASKGEIDQILAMGVDATRIIFANPCKMASHVRHATACDVRMMTFDNEQELYKVQRFAPNAEMVLRIAVSDPTAVCQLNLKFGCEPVDAALSLLRLATKLGVRVVGISFHVGSGARDPAAFALGIAHARRLFDQARELGHAMRFLDLGGGYPGYESADITFQKIGETVNAALATHFPADDDIGGGAKLQIVGEPGRYFAAAAFSLYANVIAKTRVSAAKITGQESDADQQAFMYYINDGVYGSFNCILFDHITPASKPLFHHKGVAKETVCSVWGPTCDSMDCIYKAYRLPELGVGDWLQFENMGAYTMAAASEFNGFQRPTIHYVCSRADWSQLSKFVNATTVIESEVDAGCMSDDSGVPITSSSDDETCSVVSSYPDSLSSRASSASLAAMEV